jgi:hypothetical protein
MNHTTTPELDIKALQKAVNLYGMGDATEEGIKTARHLILEQGESYAAAALEIIASGYTEKCEW